MTPLQHEYRLGNCLPIEKVDGVLHFCCLRKSQHFTYKHCGRVKAWE